MTTTFLDHQTTDFNPLNLAVDIVGEEENDFLLAGSLNVGRNADDCIESQHDELMDQPPRSGMLSESPSIEELAKKMETATKGGASAPKTQLMKKVPSGSLKEAQKRRTSGIPPPGTKRNSSKPPGPRSSNFKPGEERKEGEESVSDKTFNSHSDTILSKFEKILIEMEQEASDTYDFSGIGKH